MGGITIIASKAYWSPMASWSPRCFPDASQMPPRCFPDASQMLPRCFPDASRMRPRCFPDASSASSSPKWLLNALQKTLFGVSCWSHSFLYMLICLGTCVVESLAKGLQVCLGSGSCRSEERPLQWVGLVCGDPTAPEE
jgi:hypothetical protein